MTERADFGLTQNHIWSWANRIRWLLTALIIAAAIYIIWPEFPLIQSSLQIVVKMPAGLMLLAVLAQVGSYFGSGYLMQASIALSGGRVSTVRAIFVTLASYSVGLLVGGTMMSVALTYRWLRSSNVSQEGAGFACVLPWFCNNLFLIIVAISGVLQLLVIHELSTLQIAIFVGAGVVLGLFVLSALWAMKYRGQLTTLAHWTGRKYAAIRRRAYNPGPVNRMIEELFGALHMLQRGGWRAMLIGAVVNNVLDILTLYIIFVAAGHPLSFAALLTGYGLPLLFGKVGFLPGGLGVVEAAMGLIYSGLGVPKDALVVIILVYRLLAFWIPTILGFLLVPYLQRT